LLKDYTNQINSPCFVCAKEFITNYYSLDGFVYLYCLQRTEWWVGGGEAQLSSVGILAKEFNSKWKFESRKLQIPLR
jgi:hypothetical protein